MKTSKSRIITNIILFIVAASIALYGIINNLVIFKLQFKFDGNPLEIGFIIGIIISLWYASSQITKEDFQSKITGILVYTILAFMCLGGM